MWGGPGICQGDNNLHALEGETLKSLKGHWGHGDQRLLPSPLQWYVNVSQFCVLIVQLVQTALSTLYGYSLECSPFPWFPTGPCLVQHSIPVTLLVFPVPYPASAQFSFVSIGPDTLLCSSFPTFKPEPFPVCGVLTPSVCSCNKPHWNSIQKTLPIFLFAGLFPISGVACTSVCVTVCWSARLIASAWRHFWI